MTPARAQTWTTWSGVECTSHEAMCLYSVICCSIAILSNYILLYEVKLLHKVYTITSCIETATFYPKYYSSGHRMHASNVGFFCLLFVIYFFCFTGVLHPLEDFWDGTPNEYASDCPMSLYRSFLWNRTCTLTLLKFYLWSNFIFGRLSQKP